MPFLRLVLHGLCLSFKAERKRASKTPAQLREIADRATAVTRAKTACERLIKVLSKYPFPEELPDNARASEVCLFA